MKPIPDRRPPVIGHGVTFADKFFQDAQGVRTSQGLPKYPHGINPKRLTNFVPFVTKNITNSLLQSINNPNERGRHDLPPVIFLSEQHCFTCTQNSFKSSYPYHFPEDLVYQLRDQVL
jgi:hypothetical protein